MPLPYMGSKRDSSGKIYQVIKNHSPESNTICDLFCGGWAISEYFFKNGFSIISNDKNKYIIALLEKIFFNSIEEEKFLQFVSREEFQYAMENKEKCEDWYIGFLMTCWTFGNNQRDYIYGKEFESIKKAGHELVVNKNPELFLALYPTLPIKYIEGILKQKDWQTRRIAFLRVLKAFFKSKKDPDERYLQNLQNLERLGTLANLKRLANLERLERLENLHKIGSQDLKNITLSSNDYREVKIPKNAIVYCDPPYFSTAIYAEGGFNHKEFWEWARETSKTNKIFISEYSAPSDVKVILEFSRRSLLAKTDNHQNEKLFTF